MALDPLPSPAPGTPVAPPVAPSQPLRTPGLPPVAPSPVASATDTVPLFGGHRGGKRRADGLPAGSPEAREADRLKDAERKRRARLEAKANAEPAPLPPSLPCAPAPAVGAPPPSPDAVGAVPGPAPVPWEAGTLKPLFDQLLPTVEALTVAQLTTRATKARLPSPVVAEIGKDAAWPSPARKALEVSSPRVAAKWLNRTGLSAEHQDELILGTAICSIFASHTMLLRKLDKLIADANAAQPPTAKPTPPAP